MNGRRRRRSPEISPGVTGAIGPGSVYAGGNVRNVVTNVTFAGDQASLTDRDLLIRQQAAAKRLQDDYDQYFMPRARGSVANDGAGTWDFAGRREALRRVVAWLAHPDGGRRPGLVLTGAPGSGKTAVLGLLATLSSHRYRSNVPPRVGVDAETTPPTGCFDHVVYASGLQGDELVDILHFLGLVACGPVTPAAGGGAPERAGDSPVITVLIDAVDEAADPQLLVDLVLKPRLQKRSVRMVLGMRTELASQLSGLCEMVDLDDDCADPDAMRRHVEHVLLQATERSPFRSAASDVVAEVAAGIVRTAGSSFLLARDLARMLADRSAPPNLASDWESELPRLPGEVMEQNLVQRLGRADAERALDLLRPLAFAEGRGLPDEDVWSGLAGRLAGRTYTYTDLLWLREHVGSYAVRSSEGGQTVYQPYHLTLSEHLRNVPDRRAVHRTFIDFFLRHTALRPDGTRDWRNAPSYTRSYLATHIAKAGGHDALSQLMLDPGYLLAADPYRLLGALADYRPPAGPSAKELRTAVDVYRQAASDFRRFPPELRASALDLAARAHGSPTLMSRMEPVPDTAPWKARWVDLAPPRRSGYTLTTLSDPVTRLTVFRHAGDQYVACASDSGEVEVWNLDMNRQVLRTNTTADIPITGLDTGVHDGAVFLAASDPTTVYLWEIFGGGRLTASWKAGNDYSDSEATAVAFADIDDRLVLHVLDDGHDVERFDVTKRERLPNLRLSDNHGFHRYHASVAVTILNAAPTAVIGTWGGVHLADLRTGRTSRLTSPDPGGFVAGVRRVPGRGPLRLVTGALNHRIHELRFPGDSMTVRRCPESVRDVDVRLHDGKAFVLAAYDGSDRPLEVFSLAGDGFSTSDFYVDGREAVYQVRSVELHHGHWVVIAGERSGRVHVWDFPELPS